MRVADGVGVAQLEDAEAPVEVATLVGVLAEAEDAWAASELRMESMTLESTQDKSVEAYPAKAFAKTFSMEYADT